MSVMVRMTQAGAEYLDSNRGDLSRAEFLRRLLAEHATGAPVPTQHREISPEKFAAIAIEALRADGYTVVKKGG